MAAFSDSGFGAILASEEDAVLDINAAGTMLLNCSEKPLGKPVREVAPFLLDDDGDAPFGNPVFNRYLLPCPAPAATDLPPGERLLVFRDATKDFRHDVLDFILNHVTEAIAVWDGESRMLMLNDTAAKLETQAYDTIAGKHISSLYHAGKGSVLAIPLVIDRKKPVLNFRQNYLTQHGKELQIVSNSYPVLKDGKLLAAVCMMEDWTITKKLSARVMDLQQLLVDRSGKARKEKTPVIPVQYSFDDIVFRSAPMREAVAKCRRVAESDSFVMLYGETGTGKELFAQSIHGASRRSGQPFLAVNCAAIPETLLESMLFGTEKGAYTGAEQRHGLFEQADNGTLLLDEINSMDIALQAKLLRVLQDGVFRRVGGTESIKVDVRVFSNTNIPPARAVAEKLLRADLFHRPGVVNITIPPLRERREDIVPLAKSFIQLYNKKFRKNIVGLTPDTLDLFFTYDWPGNVRELGHAIEYAMNMLHGEKKAVTPEYIPEHILIAVNGPVVPGGKKREQESLESVMENAGRRFLRQVLTAHEWNITRTAEYFNITRQNLQHRMKKLGVRKESDAADGRLGMGKTRSRNA